MTVKCERIEWNGIKWTMATDSSTAKTNKKFIEMQTSSLCVYVCVCVCVCVSICVVFVCEFIIFIVIVIFVVVIVIVIITVVPND